MNVSSDERAFGVEFIVPSIPDQFFKTQEEAVAFIDGVRLAMEDNDDNRTLEYGLFKLEWRRYGGSHRGAAE